MVELSLCNELLAEDGHDLDAQCRIARALGYSGLELAPGAVWNRPHEASDDDIAACRRIVEGHGLRVTGLHWLLRPYPELSITDPAAAEETQFVLTRLVEMCAALGGDVLVHGSPGQRQPPDGEPPEDTLARVAAFFGPVAERAEALGVIYCIEPLARAETPLVNTVADGVGLVEAVGSPAFRTMIDTSAAGRAEAEPVADAIRRWQAGGHLAHIHLNDTNRGAPGTGDDPFPAIIAALYETGWRRPVTLEPFWTRLDATVTAAIGAATIRACWQAAGGA